MNFANADIREQIVKTVVRSGNGGAVWVPKQWLGQEVVVILPQKPKRDLRENIIHLLEPYLKDILSVFIYGSYARNEQTKDSDVDVMVITNKKIKISIKEPKLEIAAFELEKFRKAIEKHPVMYYNIVYEAEPLINSNVLQELKNIKINIAGFRDYIKETKEHIKSNEQLLELDKLDDNYVKSHSVIYSTMLRLRGIFIMKCILDKEKFSNKLFKAWLAKNNLTNKEFEQFYEVYGLVRDNKIIKTKIEILAAEKLLNTLINQLILIGGKV